MSKQLFTKATSKIFASPKSKSQFVSLPSFLEKLNYSLQVPITTATTAPQLSTTTTTPYQNARIIGLDVGNKFVGVSISDEKNEKAQPSPLMLKRYKNDVNMHQMSQSLDELCEQYGVMAMVVGVPSSFKQQVLQICQFVQQLTRTSTQLSGGGENNEDDSLEEKQRFLRGIRSDHRHKYDYQLKHLPHLPILLQDETYTTFEAYDDILKQQQQQQQSTDEAAVKMDVDKDENVDNDENDNDDDETRVMTSKNKRRVLSTLTRDEKIELDQTAAIKILQRTLDDLNEQIRQYRMKHGLTGDGHDVSGSSRSRRSSGKGGDGEKREKNHKKKKEPKQLPAEEQKQAKQQQEEEQPKQPKHAVEQVQVVQDEVYNFQRFRQEQLEKQQQEKKHTVRAKHEPKRSQKHQKESNSHTLKMTMTKRTSTTLATATTTAATTATLKHSDGTHRTAAATAKHELMQRELQERQQLLLNRQRRLKQEQELARQQQRKKRY